MREETTKRPNDGDVLDCGHVLEVSEETKRTGTGGTGYGTGTRDGKTKCYPCCDADAREELAGMQPGDKEPLIAYLGAAPDSATLTTWSGGELARVTRLWRVRNNFAGELVRFHAVGPTGRRYYGTSPGFGMYARVRAAK